MNIFKPFSYILFAKLVSMILILLSRIFLARILGPADLGSFGSALNFTTLIARFSSFGIVPATQFISGKYPQKKNAVLTITIISSLVLGILNLLIVYIFRTPIAQWQFAEDESGKKLFLQMVMFLPVILLSMNVPIFLLGRGRYNSYTISQILPLAIQTGFLALLLLGKYSFQTAVFAQIAYWSVMAGTGIVMSGAIRFSITIDPVLINVFKKVAINMFPLIVLQYGLARFAVLAGSHYLPSASLGQFILASNLTEAMSMVYTAVTPVIFNLSLKCQFNTNLLVTTIRFSSMVMALLFPVMLLSGKPIFLYMFGDAYEKSWTLFLLLFPGMVMHGMSMLLIHHLIASEMTSRVFYIYLAGLITLIGCSVILCPVYGAPGLCCALSLSSTSTLLITSLVFNRITGQNLGSLFIPRKEDWMTLKKRAMKKTRGMFFKS